MRSKSALELSTLGQIVPRIKAAKSHPNPPKTKPQHQAKGESKKRRY